MERHDDVGKLIAEDIARTIARKIAIGFALFFGFLFFIAFGGALVMWLWNWLVPDLFGLRRLGLWEALGLLALCRILFGSFGGGHGGGNWKHRGKREHKEWWKTPKPAPDVPSSAGLTHE
jgi:hypothetical protein